MNAVETPGPILSVDAVRKNFGGVVVLDDIDLAVAPGEIVGLIGPNGAGKSTLLSILSGILKPSEGRVWYRGQDITARKLHQVARLGIARTLQTPQSFLSMTVLENARVGALFGHPQRRVLAAREALDVVGLGPRADSKMSELNLQERKIAEIARALAMAPRVLLLDEPLSGLHPGEIQDAMNLIRAIRRDAGVTIIWVEHHVRAIMEVADRVAVLNFGQLIAQGSPAEVSSNQRVIEAYLGVAH